VIHFKQAQLIISVRKKGINEIDCDDCVGLCPKKGLEVNVTKLLCRVTVILVPQLTSSVSIIALSRRGVLRAPVTRKTTMHAGV
jgi:hypothetical protein